jgi:hypothetical protein
VNVTVVVIGDRAWLFDAIISFINASQLAAVSATESIIEEKKFINVTILYINMNTNINT